MTDNPTYAKVVRSALTPPGQIIVGQLPGSDEKLLILPPETSDEVLAQAEEMVRAHNDFAHMMTWFREVTAQS